MRGIHRLEIARLAFVGCSMIALVGAAPATPTYLSVQKIIDSVRQSWQAPGSTPQPNQAGWDALFDALLGELKSYNHAASEADRLAALEHINEIKNQLAIVPWTPAGRLAEEIRQWLRPRLHLAEATRQLNDTVAALPPTADAAAQSNRNRWLEFAQNDLGSAVRDYDRAETVGQRQAALRRVHDALATLDQRNQSRPWRPTTELQAALNDLYNQPNLDIAADVPTVSPFFNANLVQTGPVYRKGYWSQVTAGPKTGFGLLASDDGIAFFNKQTLVSVTPITDFQNQIAQDPQGQRAAKLYQFSATTVDASELTITTVLRPWGLSITPYSTHNINANICSAPTDGGGLGRTIAALIGMDQDAITQRVKDGAMPKFQQRIPVEAQEEALERIGRETADRNADLRSKGLVGNDTLAIQDYLITNLSMRSRPEAVFLGGLFQWKGVKQFGADLPQPPKLAASYEPGVTADLHLGSLLTTAAAGAYQRDDVRSVQNLMVTIRDAAPGTSPRDAVTVTKNVDFTTYTKAVDDSRKPESKATVLRLARPENPPEFSTSSKGNLVAVIRDFQLDVPAPPSEAKGGVVGAAAKTYRIKVPQLEVALGYTVDSTPSGPIKIHANVADFNPGTNSEVLAIADDETKAVPLSRFSGAIVLSGLGGRLRSQPIDLSLDQLKVPGIKVRSISPLDPSGWVRVGLEPTGEAGLQLARPEVGTPTARSAQPVAVTQPGLFGQR